MDMTQLALIFIISLFLGSFYNLLALRSLTGEEVIFDRSRCVDCGESLSFIYMIPVISYLFLRGRCFYCGSRISRIYLLGELMTAIFYTIILNKYGFTIESMINLVSITIMILATITDLKSMLVPNSFILLGLFLVILIRFIFDEYLVFFLLEGFFSFIVLYLVYFATGGKIGGADVKIYGLIGLTIGFKSAMNSLFYASFLSLIFIIIYYLRGNHIKGLKLPFVPFISLGMVLTYIV